MEILCKIAPEYKAALLAALPEAGLRMADAPDPVDGYCTIMEDDTPKDLSAFWTRFEIGKRTLNNAGIISAWERDLPGLITEIRAKYANHTR